MNELPYYNSFFRCATPPAVLLAQKIAGLAPKHLNQVFFGSSGSESNDTALRLVRHFWALEGRPEKNRIISRRMAYHGSTIAGASLGGMEGMHGQLGGAVPNIVHVMPPYAFELAEPGESDHDFGLRAASAIEDAILEAGADRVAAVIGEPVMGAGGVKIPPASYWPEVQRICRAHDVLLMFDEVITGYGRTGHWFAAETFGVEPDTITTAKALTSGYLPLSALLVSDRIAATLVEKGGEFFHGYTYSGHPVCLRGRPGEPRDHRKGGPGGARTRRHRPVFRPPVAGQVSGHGLVGETRAIGLMAAIEIVSDKRTKERFQPAGTAATMVRDHSIANGLMMRATGDTMILSPPLIWTRETIDLAIDRILKALDGAEAKLRGRS